MVMRAQPVCWLLMVDIKRYTTVSRQLDTDPLSLRVGTWLRLSRDAIESAGGVIDKFLGDAIFAYWKNNAEAPVLVSRALHQLVELQQRRDLIGIVGGRRDAQTRGQLLVHGVEAAFNAALTICPGPR